MRILTLVALLIAIAAVTFALQNSAPVAVQFLIWRSLDLSMALILLITFSFGVLFGILVSLPPAIKGMRKRSKLMQKIDQQNYEIENLNRQLPEITHQLPTPTQHYLPKDTSSNYPSDASVDNQL
ncbi:LapA family protein [Halotia branconii]|uniref:LapA family protein n=1 Tax=Halotia branconii CENA392 TaxID=1539056 RepID=A0AAJ6P7N9_9CYAN|nr:LapA family protein [Halotia branconii]WGV23939.1 LapA family protein [Halotia branconii CENA392]